MNILALLSQKRREKGVRRPSKGKQEHLLGVHFQRHTAFSARAAGNLFPLVAVLTDKSILNSISIQAVVLRQIILRQCR